jgi:hypothetical protein
MTVRLHQCFSFERRQLDVFACEELTEGEGGLRELRGP